MASKFLNLSTDTTLGGNAPSDEIVSSQKALKTYIDNNSGGGGLPDQTGNSGKFLTTNGTDASWSDKPLVNTATGLNALTVLGTATNQTLGINIGVGSTATDFGAVSIGGSSSSAYEAVAVGYYVNATGDYSVSVGSSSRTNNRSIAIGRSSHNDGTYSISIGYSSSVSQNKTCGIAIGSYSLANADHAIQIGNKATDGTTTNNNDANTFKVANVNGNYEIMSADGTIPTDRFTTTPSADGTYVPTLTISSGTATRSWAAPGGGSSYTAGTGIDITSNVISVDLTAGDGIGVSGATISLGDIDCGTMPSPPQQTITFNLSGTPGKLADLTVNGTTYTYADFTNNSLSLTFPYATSIVWSATASKATYSAEPSSGNLTLTSDTTITIRISRG